MLMDDLRQLKHIHVLKSKTINMGVELLNSLAEAYKRNGYMGRYLVN